MDLDTFLAVACLIGAVICYAIVRYCEANVYVKYNKTGNAKPISRRKGKRK